MEIIDSRTYWKNREEEHLKNNLKTEEEYKREINRIYDRMMVQIQKEINDFYVKYAKKEGITMAEAKKRVKKLDIEAYAEKAKKYVKNKDFSDEANEEMRLYNLTMKINRLEMLKAQIGLELVDGFNDLQKYFDEKLTERTLEEFKRQAGILGETVNNNAQLAHTIVNASFHNAKYSERIWANQTLLKAEISKLLQTGMIQGKNPRVLAAELIKKFGVNRRSAERLMITELARVQTEAQRQSFERNGFEQYEFIALGTACDVCKALDGKFFDVKKMMPGENAPPMHPHCRCSTAGHMDRKEYEAWLDFLDKGGTTEEWKKLKNSPEKATYHSVIKRIGSNNVDLGYIKSEKYRKKFSNITDNISVNNAIRQYATAILTHRNGTDGEDLYIIEDKKGELILRKNSGKNQLEVEISKEEAEKLRSEFAGRTIGIHNHPTNVLPTGSDFTAAGYRKYRFGIVVTHDGRIFKYSVGDKIFTPGVIDNRVDKYTKKPYDLSIEKAHEKALKEVKEEYDISWEELK